jgi:hypothetical protein
MQKVCMFMGSVVIVDDDDDLLAPNDQMALISLLEKTIYTNLEIIPNEDGSFTYSFDCIAPKVTFIKA